MERAAKVLRRYANAQEFTVPLSTAPSFVDREGWIARALAAKRREYYRRLKEWWRGVPKAKKAATLRFMRAVRPG